jgi:hypothetical protein
MEDGLFFVPEDGHVFAGGAGKCGLKHWPLEKIKRNKVHVVCISSIEYTVSHIWNRSFQDGKDLLELCA